MDRDFYLTPAAAVDFGLADKVQKPREMEAAEQEERQEGEGKET